MGSSCSFLVLVSYTRALRTAVSLMSDPVDDSSVEPVKTKPDSSNQAKETKSKKPKNKCAVCKKKLGLTGFECRCGKLFCGLHRYTDKHECSFDYKESGRAELTAANPVIAGEKIQKTVETAWRANPETICNQQKYI